MGSLFGAKAPQVTTPPPPAAPVQEATFQPGGDKTDAQKKQVKLGKKRLQIPAGSTTTATTSTGVNTGV